MIAVWSLYGSTLSLFCTRELMDLLHVARLRCIYIPKSHRNITKLLAVSSLAHTGIGWIIQELSVAQNRSPLFCGEGSITWQELTDVLEFVWHDWDLLLTGLQQTGLPLFQNASKTWILIMRLRTWWT
jgi:hypothetical protein